MNPSLDQAYLCCVHLLWSEKRKTMTETASPLKYHDIEELQALPLEELAALVDQIPTERARAYKQQYDRWLRQQGVMTTVGSDGLEQTILLDLFEQYQATGLVPAGEAAWVRV